MALNERNTGGAPGGAERDPLLDRLYREAGHEAPPAHLDAAILAAARREVGARPRPVGSFLRAWRMPVSVAAVVVLSVTIVTLMREEGADRLVKAPLVAPPAAEAPVPPPADAVKELSDAASKQRAAAVPPPVAKPEPAPPVPRVTAPVTSGLESTEPRATAAAPARTAEPLPSAAQERRQAEDTARRSAPAQPGPDQAAASRADRESAPPAPARVLSAPVAAPAVGARGASEGQALRSERPLAAVQKSALVSELERQPPEKWLEKIEELRRAGQAREAEELLAEFKRRFPSHPLPAGLR